MKRSEAQMSELADIFAFLYQIDLPTLRRFEQEVDRILRERENAARSAASAVSRPSCED
jgi:hypothetical protein